MTDTEILEDIKKIIHKEFGTAPDEIEEESYFDEDLNITDLELEDLIAQLEDKYNIKIAPEKAAAFKKVADLVAYLYENVDTSI